MSFEGGIPPIQEGSGLISDPGKKTKRTKAADVFEQFQAEHSGQASKRRRFIRPERRSPSPSSGEEAGTHPHLQKRSRLKGTDEAEPVRSRRRVGEKEEPFYMSLQEIEAIDRLERPEGKDLDFHRECVRCLKHNVQMFPQLVFDARMTPIVAKQLLQLPMIIDATPQAIRSLAEKFCGSLRRCLEYMSQSDLWKERTTLLSMLVIAADSFEEQKNFAQAVVEQFVMSGHIGEAKIFIGYLPEDIRPTLTLVDDIISRMANLTLEDNPRARS